MNLAYHSNAIKLQDFTRQKSQKYQKYLTSGANVMKAKAYSLAKPGKAENEAGKAAHFAFGITALLPKSMYMMVASSPESFSTLALYHWLSTNFAAHRSPKS